jgi:hypothetical protein
MANKGSKLPNDKIAFQLLVYVIKKTLLLR